MDEQPITITVTVTSRDIDCLLEAIGGYLYRHEEALLCGGYSDEKAGEIRQWMQDMDELFDKLDPPLEVREAHGWSNFV